MTIKAESSRLLKSNKYTVVEAAAHFRVSVRTVRRWIKAGRINTVRPFHFHLITGEEIERLLTMSTDKQS
jgi:excisionase family DNA binding protein